MARYFNVADGYTPAEFARAANDHLVSAMHLFVGVEERCIGGGPQSLDSAGYLAHLGIELVLKAGLLQATGRCRDDHNLLVILDQLRAALHDVELSDAELETLSGLNDFYRLRYPCPKGLPEVATLDWDAVYALWLALREALPAEIGRAVDEIDHTQKGGRILRARPEPDSDLRP